MKKFFVAETSCDRPSQQNKGNGAYTSNTCGGGEVSEEVWSSGDKLRLTSPSARADQVNETGSTSSAVLQVAPMTWLPGGHVVAQPGGLHVGLDWD